jgi:hypothetical protein
MGVDRLCGKVSQGHSQKGADRKLNLYHLPQWMQVHDKSSVSKPSWVNIALLFFFLWYWSLSHSMALFCDGFFQDRVSQTIFPGWFWTMNLQLSSYHYRHEPLTPTNISLLYCGYVSRDWKIQCLFLMAVCHSSVGPRQSPELTVLPMILLLLALLLNSSRTFSVSVTAYNDAYEHCPIIQSTHTEQKPARARHWH